MAESKRARKPNFSQAECTLLLQLAEENLDIIRDKFSSNVTNKRKNAVWVGISERVNALGVAKRSPSDVKEKWRAMKNAARKEFTRERSALAKTGGGQPPLPPKPTSQRLIEIFGDEPGFSGIKGGLESEATFESVEGICDDLEANELFDNNSPHELVSLPDVTPQCLPEPVSVGRIAAKKRKITSQDIQAMQYEVLELEKEKVQLEIENLKLRNKKVLLEMKKLGGGNECDNENIF